MRAKTSWIAVAMGLAAAGCIAPAGDEEDVGEAEEAMVGCAKGGTGLGVDVSYYQGKPNWKAVETAGMRFAIARINDGGFIDPVFDYDYKAIKEAGLVRGSYQFFRSSRDPIE